MMMSYFVACFVLLYALTIKLQK